MKTFKELIDNKELEILTSEELKSLKGGYIFIEDITMG
jgi:hypothetical protein